MRNSQLRSIEISMLFLKVLFEVIIGNRFTQIPLPGKLPEKHLAKRRDRNLASSKVFRYLGLALGQPPVETLQLEIHILITGGFPVTSQGRDD